jgi:hypothetical protein
MRSDGQVRADRQMLEPGVYQEFLPNRSLGTDLNMEAVIIVARSTSEGAPIYLGDAWRNKADQPWRGPRGDETQAPGVFYPDSLRPHPEADRIWAEYVASRLID